MPWIESHSVTLRHRKLLALARDLHLKPVYVLGHLHALWHATIEQQPDGNLSAWSDSEIASAAGYEGDAAKFVSLLVRHRWLDGRLVHDWLEYAGRYLRDSLYKRHPEKWTEITALHGQARARPPTVCRQSADSPPTVGHTGPDQPTNQQHNTPTAREREADAVLVERLAKESHAVFGKEVAFPSSVVLENVSELLRQGRTESEIQALFSWRKQTTAQHRPQSPATLTAPEKWEQWHEKMKEENGNNHQNTRSTAQKPAGHGVTEYAPKTVRV